MAKSMVQLIVMALLLALLQAVVFNHICLFGVAVPLAFIYALIKIPVTLSLNWSMTFGFLLGLLVDILSDTQGLNALCCTLAVALRKPVLHLYMPRDDDMSDPVASPRSMGGDATYRKYEISMALIYCVMFFSIEAMTFFNLGRLLLKIVASSVFTFLIFIIFDSITARQREKRL